ncbi:putative Fe-containing alcohol dehydrogenase [Fomitopsis serialis]|uniref:putative Fe-containing alcohol dehydrogenase n=1 Tax=Fomitopsis serialis TaxID=139415 RepID=UPI0020084B6C|nr:putative Fe-containing alcohol dehydrogenase [Neoantrodia serialis]KAH9920603.1 putative Fe-containing alcohol dehydrogenase [Neoantrodia serialis]
MARVRQFRIPQFESAERKGRDAVFGADYVSAVTEEVNKLGCSKVYLVASTSLNAQTDAVKRLEEALGNKLCGKKIGVKSHTPYDEVLQIAKETKEKGADMIVTLGSSSYSDAGKAALSLNAGHADDKTGWAMSSPATVKEPTLKLICVPASLSAAEWNEISGCTNPITRKKQHFSHPAGAPNLIVLDPQLALTTPLHLWLSTGVRAVDHCVETLCTDRSSAEVKDAAEEGLRALTEGLLKCKEDEKDVAARAECQIGSWKAARNILSKVPLGASHAITHQLGAFCGIPHGITSCIMLSPVLKYNAAHSPWNAQLQKRVSAIFWSAIPDTFVRAGLEEAQADAGDLVKAFVQALQFPTTLTEVGVGEDVWDNVAKASLEDAWGKTNPVPLESVEQVKEILAMAK